MKLKELLQIIKDEYASIALERPDGLDNHRMEADRCNDEDILRQLISQNESYDVAVTDPPRSGMHPKARESLIDLRPGRIVYVSCNPTALAQDLRVMIDAGYGVDYVQLVDMFPHTPHFEVLARVIDQA